MSDGSGHWRESMRTLHTGTTLKCRCSCSGPYGTAAGGGGGDGAVSGTGEKSGATSSSRESTAQAEHGWVRRTERTSACDLGADRGAQLCLPRTTSRILDAA